MTTWYGRSRRARELAPGAELQCDDFLAIAHHQRRPDERGSGPGGAAEHLRAAVDRQSFFAGRGEHQYAVLTQREDVDLPPCDANVRGATPNTQVECEGSCLATAGRLPGPCPMTLAIETRQVWATGLDGQPANRRGIRRTDLDDPAVRS